MWNLKTTVVPLVMGALGFIPHNLQRNLTKFPIMSANGKYKK